MTSSSDREGLLGPYLDGTLDQAGVERLGRRLAGDPVLADELVASARIAAGCRRLLRGPAAVRTMPGRASAQRRRRRPAPRRWPLWAVAACLPFLAVLAWLMPQPTPSEGGDPAQPTPGVRVSAEPGTELRPVAAAGGGARFDLLAGRAWFEVDAARAPLPVSVDAGPLAVEVVGTRFLVERRTWGAQVEVDHGEVRARHGGGVDAVRAGESLLVDALGGDFTWSPGTAGSGKLSSGVLDPGGDAAISARHSDGHGSTSIAVALHDQSGLFSLRAPPIVELRIEPPIGMVEVQVVIVLADPADGTWRGNLVAKAAVIEGGGWQQVVVAGSWQAYSVERPLQRRPARCTDLVLENRGNGAAFRLSGISVHRAP